MNVTGLRILSNFLDHKRMQLYPQTGRIVDDTRVTKLINNLVEVAEKEKDRSTYSFLQWFVSE